MGFDYGVVVGTPVRAAAEGYVYVATGRVGLALFAGW
jgi:murein DD-endopeptidase MepM/ murein hydrolase activator NlpD